MPDQSHSDGVRSYYLYRYLLGCLAISRKSDGSLNNARTAQRVGDTELRKKILPAIFSDAASWAETTSSNSKAKVTTGQVVEMLSNLQSELNIAYEAHTESYNRVLTTEDILIVLYQLVELTPDERSQIRATRRRRTDAAQANADVSANCVSGIEYESILRAYKESVGLEFDNTDAPMETLDQVNALIDASVRAALAYLPNRESQYQSNLKQAPSKEDTIIELSKKAQREVRRLLVRSGNTQRFLKGHNR